MKLTKEQVTRIINEELDLIEGYKMARAPGGNPAIDHTIFNSEAIAKVIEAEIKDYFAMANIEGLAQDEADRMQQALQGAMAEIVGKYAS